MKLRMICFAAAIGLSVTSASADPVRFAQAMPAMLPAHEIATIVRSAGFIPMSPAMRRGESYVLRASAPDGREMRVTVNARRGGIVSAVPVGPAEDAMPGERLGPYERIAPPGYIAAPEPPGVYRSGPPVVYEGDRPVIFERRPMEAIPNAPPRGPRVGARDIQPDLTDPDIMREEGALPPPPERFPQRAAPQPAQKPAAKPAPVKRAAAPPPATPLPKPKPVAEPGRSSAEAEKPAAESGKPVEAWPGTETGKPPAEAAKPAAPAASPTPQAKPDPRSLPH